MDARSTITDYYDSLRHGAPLDTFFAEENDGDDPIAKFGISEARIGSESVKTGLREQTAATTDWTVDSKALRVSQRKRVAWFSDRVELAWDENGTRHEFDTRWSGTLERSRGDWRFVGMHVSTAHDTEQQ